jgi:hypothetical protein
VENLLDHSLSANCHRGKFNLINKKLDRLKRKNVLIELTCIAYLEFKKTLFCFNTALGFVPVVVRIQKLLNVYNVKSQNPE